MAKTITTHVERFNRIIQEDFIDYHDMLLLDTDRFNERMMDWLLFYKTKRVHHAFENKLSPVQYLLQHDQLQAECKTTCGHKYLYNQKGDRSRPFVILNES